MMTNELEKQFFDTFGIEAKEAIFCSYDGACPFDYPCDECPYFLNNKGSYPQISDRIYLELYCLICDYCVIAKITVDELKQEILRNCIRLQRVVDIKHQVRTLFEEG